jgi:hypothetical protein
LLDWFHRVPYLDKSIHVDSWGHDVISVNFSLIDQFLHLSDRDTRRCRHDGIEIPRRHSVNQIACRISAVCMHDRKVGAQSSFHEVFGSLEFMNLFPDSNVGSNARTRVKGRNSRTPGPNPLRERPLRIEFNLNEAFDLARLGKISPGFCV